MHQVCTQLLNNLNIIKTFEIIIVLYLFSVAVLTERLNKGEEPNPEKVIIEQQHGE